MEHTSGINDGVVSLSDRAVWALQTEKVGNHWITAPCLLTYLAYKAPGKFPALPMKIYNTTTVIADMLLERVAGLSQLYSCTSNFRLNTKGT